MKDSLHRVPFFPLDTSKEEFNMPSNNKQSTFFSPSSQPLKSGFHIVGEEKKLPFYLTKLKARKLVPSVQIFLGKMQLNSVIRVLKFRECL